jgi:hypothetical protein
MAGGAVITVKPRAFRQFQYPTPPLCVSSDFRTRSLRRVLDATIEAALRPGRTS